ncbi:MAG: DUF1559 domain-containing protein [Planctomycetia bacterium]|nr:DUF1559 domain-containing protein [Planctomycetia bacterium]
MGKHCGAKISVIGKARNTKEEKFEKENLQCGKFWSTEEFQVGFCYPRESRANYRNTSLQPAWYDPGGCNNFVDVVDAATKKPNGCLVDATTNNGREDDAVWDARAPMKPNQCAQHLETKSYGWFTARPSSYHPGTFVVALCDGSVRVVKEDIDGRALRQSMCPNDKLAGIAGTYSISDL